MAVDQADRVDFLGIHKASGDVVLTICDHLDWEQDEGEHLLVLQEKLNAYLSFIESGEMNERFPQTRGRNVTMSLVAKYPLSEEAQRFFNLARTTIEGAGFSLEFRVYDPGSVQSGS